MNHRLAQLTSLNTKLHNLDKEQKYQQKQVKAIKSLHFAQLHRRWSRIEIADKFTNSWLFDESQTTFLEWLREGKGMFWISGKPGSGKSTLMKFAFAKDDTRAALMRWAGSAKLHTASFFFWNQGFEMQKSKAGLLQSLLYQLLRRAPELIPQKCYDHPVHETWEFSELVDIFHHITRRDDLEDKFCFFIDGLDEYGGEEEDLSKVLSTLSQGPHEGYSLAVQDFTKEDMITHVRQRLRQNEMFRSLQDSEELFQEIVAKITEHAQGVWLWVSLVVRDLVRAVNGQESGSTLKRIIEEFPEDLEGYFDQIIRRIKSLYRRDSVRIFRITLEEVQPLPLFAFSLLDAEENNPRYAIDAKISPISDQQLLEIETPWKSRIINRCGDLLLVVPEEHPVFLRNPVDFMHRTVRDFLEENLKRQAESIGDQDYKPLVSLCNMMLYLLKNLPETDLSDRRLRKASIHRIIRLTDELLYYAHEDDRSDNPSDLIDILDEVDHVNNIHAGNLNNHWTHARDLPRTRGLDEYREGGNCNFLALAIQARLFNYVKAKLEANPEKLRKPGRPLLDYALRPRRVTAITMPYHSERNDPSVDTRMIQLLLSLDADPNQKAHLNDGRSVWAVFLLSMYETINLGEESPGLKEAWYSACDLLIQHGADLECWLDTGTRLTARSILEMAFGKEMAARLTNNARIVKAQNTTASWFSRFW
ncbi:hypothetical protein G7054_g4399 [Neopestalotiopsis clavispora]|nr:hypothetical protein G7054_g4399 [Neopestalotiopsis clavispora]